MCTGVRIPGFIMRFPVRRESAVPPILSRDVPRDWPGGRLFGWGKFFPVYCVPGRGSLLGDAAGVGPSSGVQSMLGANVSLWG